jgi:lysophospholipase L1-like esterase
VIAFTVAPWGGFSRFFSARRAETTRKLNDWIRSRPAAGEVDVVIDTYPLLSCGDPERLCERYAAPFSDGLHFGPEGHARLADQLLAEAFPDCRAPAPGPRVE